jgi:hypothetical protein
LHILTPTGWIHTGGGAGRSGLYGRLESFSLFQFYDFPLYVFSRFTVLVVEHSQRVFA